MGLRLLVLLLFLPCNEALVVNGEHPTQFKDVGIAGKEKVCPVLPRMEVDMCISSNFSKDGSSEKEMDDTAMTVPEGTTCLVGTDQGLIETLTCTHGDWKLEVKYGKYYVGQEQLVRRKRFWGAVIPVLIEILPKVICFFFCKDDTSGASAIPPNNPPNIACPDIPSPIYTGPGKTTAIVSWDIATATDPEDGPIGVVPTYNDKNGQEFVGGTHSVSFKATDTKGSSVYCTSTFKVIVKTCSSEYTNLFDGTVTCQPYEKKDIYGNRCEYTCDDGYELNGPRTVECEADGWTQTKPSCKAISCEPPSGIDRGSFDCPDYNYKSECIVSCDEGFEIVHNDIIRCQANKEWTAAGECKDTGAPEITCGGDIKVFAGPQLAPVIVTWPEPLAQDNSGTNVSVTSNPKSGSLFDPGQTKVTFIATDEANNRGQCSITVYVEVKRCDNFKRPNNSDVSCSHSNAYGSKCDVTCHQAYELIGERTQTCQENMTWSGIRAQCTERSCPAPPTVINGYYDCANGQKYQDSCRLICDSGFKPIAPLTITCNINIKWSQTGSCIDVQVPVFPNGCPSDMIITAASFGQPTYVAYKFPDVIDNSNETVTVIGDPISGSAFSIGTTAVTVTAIDYSGNNDSCDFLVTVRYSSCSKPNLDNTGKDLIEYDCENDYVYGATCQLSCTDGNPLTGANIIKCDKDDKTSVLAWTWSGNVAPYCDPEQCKKLAAPLNGALACDSLGSFGEQCLLLCNENYTYPASAPERYTCFTSSGTWSPNSYVPGCTRKRRPGEPKTKPEFYYFTNECNQNETEIKEKFLEAIAASNFESLCTPPADCSIDTVLVTCGPVSPSRRRKKRAADQFEYKISPQITFGPFHEQETPQATLKFYEDLAFKISENLTAEANEGLFDIPEIGKLQDIATGLSEFSCPPGMKLITTTMSCAGCGEGFTYENTTSSCTECPRGSYQDQNVSFSCNQCPEGKTTRGTRSVTTDQCLDLCLPGQYSSSGIQPCKACPIGKFQSEYGSTDCKFCFFGMSTSTMMSSSQDDCQFFDVKMTNRTIGPNIQLYDHQPSTFTILFWISAASSSLKTTWAFTVDRLLATRESAIIYLQDFALYITPEMSGNSREIRKWNHLAIVYNWGTVSLFVDGLVTSTVGGFNLTEIHKEKISFMDSEKLNSVTVSGFQMTTSALTQNEVTQFSSSCSERLNNNILVVDEVDDTLIPSICDDTNNCLGQPCGQHGTCIDLGSYFSCLCDDLWSGDTCQIEPDFCVGHECSNGASCVNQPELGNYSCACAEGFKGKLCTQLVVNGNWNTWSGWSECSVSCGNGTISRTRQCDNPMPDPEGENCHGDSEEKKNCEAGPCPVPCLWSQWTDWVCDSTCGTGTATRTRYQEQKAAHGGQDCLGPYTNRKHCETPDCSVNGLYGDWSTWSQCSVSCGGGVSSRNRTCYSFNNEVQGQCEGPDVESKACNQHDCPVCGDLELVQGQKEWKCVKDEQTDMQTCELICEQGLTALPLVETTVKCGRPTGYYWSKQTRDNPIGILPSCTDQKIPQKITPEVSYEYEIDCNNPPPASVVKSTIESQMKVVNCTQDGTCDVTTEMKLSCNSRKRSSGSMTATLFIELTAFNDVEPIYASQKTEQEAEADRKRLKSVDEILHQIVNTTDEIFVVPINGIEYKGQIEQIQVKLICQEGSGIQGGMCVDCPPGSYSARNGSCILCDKGFYQEQARMSSCLLCPSGTTTSGKGSDKASQCLEDPPLYEDFFPSYIGWDKEDGVMKDNDETDDLTVDKDSENDKILGIALGSTAAVIVVAAMVILMAVLWSKAHQRKVHSSFTDIPLRREISKVNSWQS